MALHQARKTWPDSLGSLESEPAPGRGTMYHYGWNDTSPPASHHESIELPMQVKLGLEQSPVWIFQKNGPESADFFLIKKNREKC